MTALPIHLPKGFISLVKIDEAIAIGQKIASKTASNEESVNIPLALSIKNNKVRNVIRKIPGERVSVGDILAVKKSLFGGNKILRSAIDGTILRYERDSGNLIIQTSNNTNIDEIISPVEGKVSMCDNTVITINTDKSVLMGRDGTGGVGQGEIFVLREDNPYFLNSHAIGKVVVGKTFTREMLMKGVGIGVKGILASEISQKDSEYIQKRNFDTPIISLDHEGIRKIAEWNQKKVFINGHTKSIIFLHI